MIKKRISYPHFKVLWSKQYMREQKKRPHEAPAVLVSSALVKVARKYRYRRVNKNPFYFVKPPNYMER